MRSFKKIKVAPFAVKMRNLSLAIENNLLALEHFRLLMK